MLVAAMGERPSSGYVISIDAVVRPGPGSVIAEVTQTLPTADCAYGAEMTLPVDAVIVEGGERHVRGAAGRPRCQ